MDTPNHSFGCIQKAQRFPGPCHDITAPYTSVVRLGVVPAGTYTVEAEGLATAEKLTVAKMHHRTIKDDFLYAPVENVQVKLISAGKFEATLSGRYTNSCLFVRDVHVIRTGATIQVLPIVKADDRDLIGRYCLPIEKPFEVNCKAAGARDGLVPVACA